MAKGMGGISILAGLLDVLPKAVDIWSNFDHKRRNRNIYSFKDAQHEALAGALKAAISGVQTGAKAYSLTTGNKTAQALSGMQPKEVAAMKTAKVNKKFAAKKLKLIADENTNKSYARDLKNETAQNVASDNKFEKLADRQQRDEHLDKKLNLAKELAKLKNKISGEKGAVKNKTPKTKSEQIMDYIIGNRNNMKPDDFTYLLDNPGEIEYMDKSWGSWIPGTKVDSHLGFPGWYKKKGSNSKGGVMGQDGARVLGVLK